MSFYISFGLIIFFATFVQGIAGFAAALIAMPLVMKMLGAQTAVPLMAPIFLFLMSIMLIRYRSSMNFKAVWRLAIATLFGIPFGLYILRHISEAITLPIFGVFIVFYAVYNLMGLKLPELKNQTWAFVAGFFGGIMSGAFNTSGPPIVAYAHSQKWEVKEFKANLQAYFLMTTIMANFSHLAAGNFQGSMLPKILFALPFVLLGNSLGIYVSKFIKPEIFRKVVLVLLLVIGIKMLF